MQEAMILPHAINALLSLFLDSAHSIEIVRVAVSQVPVVALPLYALAKQMHIHVIG